MITAADCGHFLITYNTQSRGTHQGLAADCGHFLITYNPNLVHSTSNRAADCGHFLITYNFRVRNTSITMLRTAVTS